MAFRNLTKTFVDLRNGAKANSLNDSFNENSNNGPLTVGHNNHTMYAAISVLLTFVYHNYNFLQSAAETTNWKAVQDINPCFPHVWNDTIEQAEALTPEIQSKSKFALHIYCCGHIS